MRLKKFLIFLLILSVVISSSVFAGSARRKGTSGAQELTIPVGAVGTALNGSFTAAIRGAEAIFWNPAGVADIPMTGEAMVSRMNYIADIYVNYLAVFSKFGRIGALGAFLKTIDFGEIPITTTDSPDGTGEYYTPRYFTFGVTYSRVMTDRIRAGVNVKMISEQVMRVGATGFAIDAGVQYATSPNGLKIGVSIKNLGMDMKFDGPDLEQYVTPPGTEPGTGQEPWRVPLAKFELPTQMEMGIAYTPLRNDMLKLTVGGAFVNDNFYYDQYRAGFEVEMMKMFFLRGSTVFAQNPETDEFMNLNDEFIFGPAFGAGMRIGLGGNSNIFVDYAFRKTKYFTGNQWLSIRVTF